MSSFLLAFQYFKFYIFNSSQVFRHDSEHPENYRISRNSNVFGKSGKTDSRVQNIFRFRVTAQARLQRFVGVHSCFIWSLKPRNVISVENVCGRKK